MHMSRIRTREGPIEDGSYSVLEPSGVVTRRIFRYRESSTCEDVVGNPHGDNPFDLTSITYAGGRVGGGRSDTTIGGYDCPASWTISTGSSNYPQPPAIDYAALATKALAYTNPSRPDLLLPVAAFELRELPDMIRHAGSFLITRAHRRESKLSELKQAAAANLAIQFGWLPLLSDLASLASFPESLEKRQKEMNRLFSGSGLKRTVKLQNWQSGIKVVTRNYVTNKLPAKQNDSVQQRVWASVRWKPDSAYPRVPPSQPELVGLMLGLHPSQITLNLWEALPWSWLIDWFAGVQDTLTANLGTIPARCVSCCVMSERTYLVQAPPLRWRFGSGPSQFDVTASALTRKHVIKRRRTTIPGLLQLNPTFPMLGVGQVSILGSLAITRQIRG